jgi:methanogenic corrinoid protein MtbC1
LHVRPSVRIVALALSRLIQGAFKVDNPLVTAVSNLKEPDALQIVRTKLANGEDPLEIINDARQGLEIVGQRFQEGSSFIPELVYSGKILEAIVELATESS